MANDLAVKDEHQLDAKTLLSVVSGGDCAALTPEQKVMYYRARCEAAGLDYRAQPFQFIKLQGKEVLYALKACTDQLAAQHGIVCEVLAQVTDSGIRTVTVRARTRDGRQTDEIGCVHVGTASGDQLANVYMKAVTKAKRRAVLSICGLGMIDETELETIKNVDTPPSLPLPRRKGEKAQEVPKPAPQAIEVPTATLDAPNAALDTASEPLVVPDRDSQEVTKGEDGSIQGIFMVKDVRYAEGTGKNGPWKKWAAVIDLDEQEITPSTFSESDGAVLADLKGKDADLSFKPNGKYWKLISVAPCPF